MSANFRSARIARSNWAIACATLTEDLQKAVAEENYESAAALRDQIKQLEHEKASLDDEIFQRHGDRRRMAARRRAAPPDRHQQPRPAGAQSSAARVSGLGEESRAHAGSRVDQAARRRAAGDAGFVLGIAAGSFRAGKAGAGRAASHQPRACGEERRQRRDHESPADAQHHGERRGSPAHAIDPLRPAVEERVQARRQSRQHARGRSSISPTTRGSVI